MFVCVCVWMSVCERERWLYDADDWWPLTDDWLIDDMTRLHILLLFLIFQYLHLSLDKCFTFISFSFSFPFSYSLSHWGIWALQHFLLCFLFFFGFFYFVYIVYIIINNEVEIFICSSLRDRFGFGLCLLCFCLNTWKSFE